MSEQLKAILSAAAGIPPALQARSGSVFYSGQGAFSQPQPLYILGLNPGGSPLAQAQATVARDLAAWSTEPRNWSRYIDESWEGKARGSHGMQPRMRHMFAQLDLDLRQIPASNIVFVRSSGEVALAAEKSTLMKQCWPVHEAVIQSLKIRTILCLGGTAGRWVRESIGATKLIATFRETNARGWTSEAHVARDGRAVVTVTHPGRVDWRNPAADPTPLMRTVLSRDS